MEELTKIAKIYFDSCEPAVRGAAEIFFNDIDDDKDGKVPLHYFLAFMKGEGHEKMSSSGFFKTLDRDENGTLDLMEVMTLFYIIQSGRPFCRGCDKFIAGMYFTCSKCYPSDNDAIFLCPECFNKGLYTHNIHGRDQFLDSYALLKLKRKQGIDSSTHFIQRHQAQPTTPSALNVARYRPPPPRQVQPNAPRYSGPQLLQQVQPVNSSATAFGPDVPPLPRQVQPTTSSALVVAPYRPRPPPRQAVMEEFFQTAKSYYESCLPSVKKAAGNFFNSIDLDKDGKVQLHEFLESMRQKGHKKMSCRDFFETLDRDGSGTLEFMEVLTLFYIIESGRPFCHGCDEFIAGMYFTCSKCYPSDNDAIFLCPECFDKGLNNHHPHGRSQFLDNYALLELFRKREIAIRIRTQEAVIAMFRVQPNAPRYCGPRPLQRVQPNDPYYDPYYGLRRPARQEVQPTTSSTLAVAPDGPPPAGQLRWKIALEVLVIAVNAANAIVPCVANLCTIM